jgi:hypothetical protein
MSDTDKIMDFFTRKTQTQYIIMFENNSREPEKLFIDGNVSVSLGDKDEDTICAYVINKYGDLEYKAVRIDNISSTRIDSL